MATSGNGGLWHVRCVDSSSRTSALTYGYERSKQLLKALIAMRLFMPPCLHRTSGFFSVLKPVGAQNMGAYSLTRQMSTQRVRMGPMLSAHQVPYKHGNSQKVRFRGANLNVIQQDRRHYPAPPLQYNRWPKAHMKAGPWMFEGERLLTLAPKYDHARAGRGGTHGYHLAHEHNLVPVVTSHGSFSGTPAAQSQGDGATSVQGFTGSSTNEGNNGNIEGASSGIFFR